MTLEVFRSELTKRGFDDKQVAELEKMANIMQMLDDCHINRAYTAIFDSATKILTEIRNDQLSEQFKAIEREIINGTGDRQPTGILNDSEATTAARIRQSLEGR